MIGLTIGRYQPFHKGHYLSLRWMLNKCDKLVIALGSSYQRRTKENPYTAEERKKMITTALGKYREKMHFILVKDTTDDSTWRKSILDKVPEVEVLFTNSPEIVTIFKGSGLRYKKVPMFKREKYEGIQVRSMMGWGNHWKEYMLKSTIPIIQEAEVQAKIEEMAKKYPKFQDGRIDFHNATEATVLNIYLKYKNKYLIVKRSNKVLKYKNRWSCIGGYLDEPVPLIDKVLEEVEEETGITKVGKIIIGDFTTSIDKKENMTWHVCPVVVTIIKKPTIKLDWEAQEYKWVTLKEMKDEQLIPNIYELLKDIV